MMDGNVPELLSIKQTCRLTGLARTTIWLRVKNGQFPKPISLGGSRKAFVAKEVRAWIDDRIAARDLEAA